MSKWRNDTWWMSIFMITLARASVLILALSLGGAMPAPDATAGRPLIGMCLHNAQASRPDYQPAEDARVLEEIGATAWRDDVPERLPSSPGTSVSLAPVELPSRVDDMLRRSDATAVLVLYEQPPGNGLASLQSQERRDAFGRFAQGVVHAVGGKPVVYEIGNEWNMRWQRPQHRVGPLGLGARDEEYSPENYAMWAQAATRAIKATGAKAPVVVGAIGDDENWIWTRRAIAAGMLRGADGISIHLYNHCNRMPDRTAENILTRLEAFHQMVQSTSGQPGIDIYLTEYGWPSAPPPCDVPLDREAANVAQLILAARTLPWLAGSWFYELRDRGGHPDDREDHFGLIKRNGDAKPGLCSFRVAARLAAELTEARLTAPTASTRWLIGRGANGAPVWVIWTTSDEAPAASFAVPPGSRAERICSDGTVAADPAIQMMPLVIRPPAGTAARLDLIMFPK